MADVNRLESLGYRQELTRSLTRLTNYGMTLSVVSITSGITSLFSYGLVTGGPVVMVWGWLLVSFFTLCVSLGMAEICSAYPTAGGLYFWAANLVPTKYKAMASWFTGWFNLMGQFAAVASVDFGLAMLIGSVLSIGFDQWSPRPWHIVLIHLFVILSHGLCNSLGNRVLLWITYVSTWWQLIAPAIVAIALLASGKGEHHTAQFVFTSYVNRTGWSSVVSSIVNERDKTHQRFDDVQHRST
jgi:amino acid transporter